MLSQSDDDQFQYFLHHSSAEMMHMPILKNQL